MYNTINNYNSTSFFYFEGLRISATVEYEDQFRNGNIISVTKYNFTCGNKWIGNTLVIEDDQHRIERSYGRGRELFQMIK